MTTSLAGMPGPVSYFDILLCDPFGSGACAGGGGGGGGITFFSAGNLPPIFTTTVTNPTTTPNLAFNLSSAAAFTVLGNPTGVLGPPSYFQLPQTFTTAASETASLPNSRQLIAGTNISFDLTVPGQFRINATGGGGGGTGCTLPGVDTGVLTEHPLGTCFASTNFTWDNTLFNWQVGKTASPNTVGAGTTYALGPGNNLGGQTSHYALGEFNDSHLAGQNEVVMIGNSNIAQHLSTPNDISVLIGSNVVGGAAAGSGGHQLYAIGETNTILNATFTTLMGFDDIIGTTSGSEKQGSVYGYLNNIGTVSSTITDFGIFGNSNDIGGATGGTITSSFIGGFSNHIEGTVEGFIWGLDNSITASAGDVVIVGSSNTTTNSTSASPIGSADSFVGGFLNTSNNAGNFAIFGGGNDASNCSACAVVGFNVHSTTSSSLEMGVSNTAEIIVTTGKVKLNGTLVIDPHPLQIITVAFASLAACAGGTEGSMATVSNSTTATWGATITGGGTNHVLAYCDGTNWTVAGK